MYLKKFGIENFRIFNDPVEFEFKPITILIGQNNSGKSTLLKAILLLIKNANFLIPYRGFPEKLRTDFHDIGINSNNDVFPVNADHKEFKIHMEFGGTFELEFSFITKYLIDNKLEFIYSEHYPSILDLTSLNIYNPDFDRPIISYNIKWRRNEKGEWQMDSALDISSDFLEMIRHDLLAKKEILSDLFHLSTNNGIFDIRNLKAYISNLAFTDAILDKGTWNQKQLEVYIKILELKENGDSIISLKSGEFKIEELQPYFRDLYSIIKITDEKVSSSIIKFEDRFEIIFNFFNEIPKNKLRFRFPDVMPNLYPNLKSLISLFEKSINSFFKEFTYHFANDFQHIGAYRGQPKRFYTPNDSDPIAKILFSGKLKIERANELVSGILKLADSISLETIEGHLKKIMVKYNGKEFNIADMGHGIMQLLPIILDADTSYRRERSNLPHSWLLSEPEANLHPSLQSKLADLFAYIMKNAGSSFLVETHSEYLIRKLQYLIRKTDSPLKPEDVVIYYFYPPDDIPPGEKQIKKIEIDEEGNLTDNFGTGFYDESSRIALELWNMNASQKN